MKNSRIPNDIARDLETERIFSHPDYLLYVEWVNANASCIEHKFDKTKDFTYDTPEGFAFYFLYKAYLEKPIVPWRTTQLKPQPKSKRGYNLCPFCEHNFKGWYAKKCRPCHMATK